MAILDISKTSVSNLTDNQDDYSVNTKELDEAGNQDETYWDNSKWTQYHGYYKTIPELKKAIDAYATWVVGKGFVADPYYQAILENITGWGEDTFNSILWNMIVTKKIAGDAFAEKILDEKSGMLLNLKPLNPGRVRTVCDRKGIVKRYEYTSAVSNGTPKIFKPTELLHLCNDRIGNEIHGVSVVEACEWVILARNEVMADWRKVLHRNVNPLKIFELDTDSTTKRDAFITQYQNMTKDYEALFIPTGTAKLTIPQVPLQDPLSWIKYLENFFYQAVGIPKIILGGSEEFTEASSKIAYLTFEQTYSREQQELQADIWNQLQIRMTLNQPASLQSEMLSSESKNTGQVGFQPNDTMINSGKA